MFTTESDVRKYLENTKCLPGGFHEDMKIIPLSGGVSCNVWKIVTPHGRWVMKQALAKLKVEADWFSDQDRIMREQESIRWVRPFMPPESVPEVVCSDSQNYIYLMTCAPDAMIPWKDKMMDGEFHSSDALESGKLLSRLHDAGGLLASEEAETLKDLTFFKQLRVDPFHHFLALKYPQYAKEIAILVAELTEKATTFVHGDFSPKNILVGKDLPPLLLDFEVAHYGNPIFDVAFMLGHLMLKGWALRREEEAAQLIRAFFLGYGKVPEETLAHLGLMLMARIDGKSPVSYIGSENMKETIRNTGARWLPALNRSEEEILTEIGSALGREIR